VFTETREKHVTRTKEKHREINQNQNRREKGIDRMKKEKGKSISVSSPVSGEESDEKQQLPSVRFSSRNASSKYDFVKVINFLYHINSRNTSDTHSDTHSF